MRTVHWSIPNGSGMHHVAAAMSHAEIRLGVDSRMLDPFDPKQIGWEEALDADVHISHTHIPDAINGTSFEKACTKPFRQVFVVHGTPELVFEQSVRDAEQNGYNSGTSFAQHQRLMQVADAIVTFWPRHQALYDLATDKHTIVDCLPMGIDLDFWAAGVSPGKYAGTPSFLNCDNQYPFKWCVDLLKLWPWVREELHEAVFHAANIPGNLYPFVAILTARYGSIFGTVAGTWSYDAFNLRNIMKQVDYYVSAVRYGDFNRMSMEAGAAGTKVISYTGNEYADYWMPFGDQRDMAKALIAIGKGDVEPRAKTPIPSEDDMARAMIHVYERLLDRPQTNWALGGLPDALPPVIRDALLSVTGQSLPPALHLVSEGAA